MPFWSRFQSVLFGGAIGAAARVAIEPQIEPARQKAWSKNSNKVLELGVVAALRAQGLISEEVALDYAKREGYDADKIAALEQLALRAPPHGEAQDLRRRGRITDEQLRHAFAKAQIEPQYWPGLLALVDERLSPQIVALAIVRGLVPDPGILPVKPPSGGGKVKRFPVFNVDAVEEAKAGGYDLERLSVLAGIAGRPMSPEAAAQAYFRDIIELDDYYRAVSESDVRNEWRDAILETARFVISPQDAAGLRLRGWKTKEEAEALGALHGASPETMQLLYLNRGRPAAPGQMATAAVRGIDGPLGRPMDEEQFMLGVQESDIRPEWGPMLWRSRFLYPSLFQLNRLVTGGTVPPAVGADWARKARYAPEVVAALEESWQGAKAGSADSWTNRARSRLFTTTHGDYMIGRVSDTAARQVLEVIGATPEEAGNVLDLWDVELTVQGRDLTQAQILRLFKRGRWTRLEALERLLDQGLADADAEALLDAV